MKTEVTQVLNDEDVKIGHVLEDLTGKKLVVVEILTVDKHNSTDSESKYFNHPNTNLEFQVIDLQDLIEFKKIEKMKNEYDLPSYVRQKTLISGNSSQAWIFYPRQLFNGGEHFKNFISKVEYWKTLKIVKKIDVFKIEYYNEMFFTTSDIDDLK